MDGTDVIFSEVSFPHEGRHLNKVKKNAGSIKSTKSLYFTDPDASGTMARDEEVTLNIYDIYSDGPSEGVSDGGKIKRTEVTSSALSDVAPVLANGVASDKEVKKASTPRSEVKKRGSFHMKSAESVGKLSHASSSGSLHDQHFREVLSETLTRKLASSASSLVSDASAQKLSVRQDSNTEDEFVAPPPAAAATTPSLATPVQVQASQAVANGSLLRGTQTSFDGGRGSDTSPGDALETSDADVTIAHKTSTVEDQTADGHAGDKRESDREGVVREVSGFTNGVTRSDDEPSGHSGTDRMTNRQSATVASTHTDKINDKQPRTQSPTKGKFLIRYKEGPDPGNKVEQVADGKTDKVGEFDAKRQQLTSDDTVSVSSTSTAKSYVKDENFREAISGLLAGGKKPDVSTSAPSSLLRPKKLNVYTKEVSIDSPSVDQTRDDDQYDSSTFPRDNGANKDKGTVSSTPTSPYAELKVTIEGGTVGRLVQDIFKDMPLTGRAIDPSTLEKKPRTPDSSHNPEGRKYAFLVEGIDTPERPSDQSQDGSLSREANYSQTENAIVTDLSDTGIESGPASPSTGITTDQTYTSQGSMEHVETIAAGKLDGISADQDTSSLKKLEKKGFSYIDRRLAEAVVKKAGDFTARRKHESLEAKVSDHQKEAAVRSQRESVVLTEAKAKLQKKEPPVEGQRANDTAQSANRESAMLIEAKSKLQKRGDVHRNMPATPGDGGHTPKALIRASTLLEAKAKLNKTKQEKVSSHDDRRETRGSIGDNTVRYGGKQEERKHETKHDVSDETKAAVNDDQLAAKTTASVMKSEGRNDLVEKGSDLRESVGDDVGESRRLSAASSGARQINIDGSVSNGSDKWHQVASAEGHERHATGIDITTTNDLTAESNPKQRGHVGSPKAVTSEEKSGDNTSPKSADVPDSAYFSDGKTSPSFEMDETSESQTERTTSRREEVLVGVIMTDEPRKKDNTTHDNANEGHPRVTLNAPNDPWPAEAGADLTRYDAGERSTRTTVNETNQIAQEQETRKVVNNKMDLRVEAKPVKSLRELKKSRASNKVVDFNSTSLDLGIVSQSDLIRGELSAFDGRRDSDKENRDVIDGTRDAIEVKKDVGDTTEHDMRREVGEDRSNKETAGIVENGQSHVVNNNTNGGHRQRKDNEHSSSSSSPSSPSSSSSSHGSDTPVPSRPESEGYTDIPIRRISSKEMRKEIYLLNGVERGLASSGQYSDSGSAVSYGSSLMGHHSRDRNLHLAVNSRYDYGYNAAYSPGASSTQTDNTSISVPVISPCVSRDSSVSTTARDTFEYSRVRAGRRNRSPARTAHSARVLQPLTINIRSPEARGRGARSRSETRASAHRDYCHIAVAPSANDERGMFRMSRLSGAEAAGHNSSVRGQQTASQPPGHRSYNQQPSHGGQSAGARHPYRMRPRDESFNSQSSGPLSPPGRYLRVDESRGGRVPIYSHRAMRITDLEGFEYTSLGGAPVRQQQLQQPHYISQVHVDDGDDLGEVNSAISEPIYTSGSAKYSVQKAMERRGLNGVPAGVPAGVQPDAQYQSRKRRVYQVSGSTTDSRARTLNTKSTISRVRSPEVTAVDPTLQEVDKKGDRYNISVKLNAMGGRAESRHEQQVYDEQMNSLNSQLASRYTSRQDIAHRERSQRSNSYGQYEGREMYPTDSTLRQMTLVKLKDPTTSSAADLNLEGQYTTKARYKVKHDAPAVIIHGQTLSTDKEYVVKSTLGTDGQYASSTGMPSPSTLSPNRGSEAPRFTMTVNQTMTMDYVAPTDEEMDEAAQPVVPQRPPRKKKSRGQAERGSEWYYESSRSQGLLQTAPPADQRKPRKRGRGRMNGHGADDLETYLSPAEDKDDDQHVGNIPQVVRGSILIKNAIDTTGAPKVIDVVEGEDSDDDVIVEDNVNMFHGSYFQSRENPMYSSDQDLTDIREKEYKPPQFTKIFRSDDEFTEIKVNRDRGKKHRSKESRSGLDETDIGYNDEWEETRRTKVYAEVPGQSKMTREQRTQYEISRLLKGAPQGSIKQSINVEREEEDIIGPLPVNHADGSGAKPEDILNFDTVSEKVDLGLKDGKAEVTVKVRCERIVPIRGVEDMFKKSSVIVTRLIEIDLFATEERRRLWENIVRRTNQGAITDGKERRRYVANDAKLSTKDTFNLYKTFMGLAEADEAGKSSEYTRIDRKVEEERRPDLYAGTDGKIQDDELETEGFDPEELDRKLEENLVNNYRSRKLEPDTMSYMSAASETRDMLY